jgi:hypothetical protein
LRIWPLFLPNKDFGQLLKLLEGVETKIKFEKFSFMFLNVYFYQIN